MESNDIYQKFKNKLERDTADFTKHYKAFMEMKAMLENLSSQANNDPEAAKKLANVHALNNDAAFMALCAKAERELKQLNAHINLISDQLNENKQTQETSSPSSKLARANLLSYNKEDLA